MEQMLLASLAGSFIIAPMETFEYGDIRVHVQRKAFRRSTSLSVWPSGKVVMAASKGASKRSLWQFLDQQQVWLHRSLEASRKLKSRFPKKNFKSGEVYPYLGESFRLRIVESPSTFVTFLGPELVFHRPDGVTDEDSLRRLKATYKLAGRKILTKRVDLFSQKMQLQPKSLSFRAQKTIWGSCSGENKISLNWKLVVAPLWVIDYVIIHELAHIVHKNHSKKFWNLVEEHTSNRHQARNWLRENVYLPDFLSPQSELWPEKVSP